MGCSSIGNHHVMKYYVNCEIQGSNPLVGVCPPNIIIIIREKKCICLDMQQEEHKPKLNLNKNEKLTWPTPCCSKVGNCKTLII